MVGRRSTGRLPDSPSRQLILDLAKDLEQIRLHHEDLKKVHEYRQQSFTERQDEIDRVHREHYYAAIDEAYAYYDDHRREAEGVLQEHLRQVEEERRRKEEEERRCKEEQERLERERQEREAAERRRQEEARREVERLAREAAERKEKAEAEEKARQAAAEDNARRERERTQEAERQRQADLKKAEDEAVRLKNLGAGKRSPEEVNEHQRYLDLHKYMKELRQFLANEGKNHPDLKEAIGKHRRAIVKCIGQLREGQGVGANRHQTAEIREILRQARETRIPCDIRRFFVHLPEQIAQLSDTEAQVSAVFVYLLNILTKAVVSQLINEASINPKYAEPLGVVVAQVFSLEDNCFRGHALSDIFWAKYRAACPALWGFYGSEKTDDGRAALGWARLGGEFIAAQEHYQRTIGLGAGFAAVTLRNFGKTARRNPFPNWIFWKSVHKIVSIPVEELQDTHFHLLASMLRFSAERVAGFFGHVGLALLRNAIVDIPSRLPNNTSAPISSLKVLRALYETEKSIII